VREFYGTLPPVVVGIEAPKHAGSNKIAGMPPCCSPSRTAFAEARDC
jgi:hypothetical protein